MTDTLWNTKDVATHLNVKESTIRHWVFIDYIPHIKFRGAVRYRKEDILEWINRCSVKGPSRISRFSSDILKEKK
ncbi:MAG: hypothetical protein A2Z40_03645 [Deltaproteobacteria bacterium RBG_19FT_COMBO_60_16]|nr:MAG: hypothetical protein A2Z40_03645 [Deltaproteobacteria bacterium RBG_19FT_COMBO_60_16]